MMMPKGFLYAGLCCGIKASKPDLCLIFSTVPCSAAGVFTQNRARAACVDDAASRLPSNSVRAIVTNSGNANALSGSRGAYAVTEVIAGAAAALSVDRGAILTASTGVIGVPLPADKITTAMPQLVSRLSSDPLVAADAILTTDTTRKIAHREVVLCGKKVSLLGFCKGAGMIHPALATMLGYLVTDANIAPWVLQRVLLRAADKSFNRLTVDGDMSTNDSLFCLASGLAEHPILDDELNQAPEIAAFEAALTEICTELARAVAQDGEGATKRIEVRVRGAKDDAQADDLAKAVAGSSLVKAAFFGNDPNWGRVLSTIGARLSQRGQGFDPSAVYCTIQGLVVYRQGEPAGVALDDLKGRMADREILIEIEVGDGEGSGLAWGCDLTYDYVKINAEYVAQTVASPQGTVTRDGRLDTYGPTFKHRLLVEALSYIRRFTGQIAVLKYGGAAMLDESLKRSFAEDVLRLRDVGLRPVVVHGGGPEISKTLAALGHGKSTFVDGVRVTDRKDMAVVEMVLDGKINSELVALLNQAGHHAVGVSGKDGRLLEAVRVRGPKGEDLGEVGEVFRVRTELLSLFLDKGYIPVVSPTAIAEDGAVLNVNADDAAAAVAGALSATKLIYLCDVEGLSHEGKLVSELSAKDLPTALSWNDVSGGMIAKLKAVQRATEAGVASVHLIDGRVHHALIAELFTDAGVGTLVRAS